MNEWVNEWMKRKKEGNADARGFAVESYDADDGEERKATPAHKSPDNLVIAEWAFAVV